MSIDKTKTLLFTLEYPPQIGGVSKYYENLVKYWGDDIIVLTNGKKSKDDRGNIVRKPLLTKYFYPHWLISIIYLFWAIKKYKINHIIVGHILPLGTATCFVFKLLKIKYSIILHGMDFSFAISQESKKNLTKKILRKSVSIVCGNKYTAELVKTFDASLGFKINIVNPGIETNFIRNPLKIKELRQKYNLNGKQVLFSLGRLTKRKGFDKVIEAMDKVSEKEPELFYVVGGGGEEYENLKKLAENKNVIILGRLSDEERWAWLEICDIFIMASRNIKGDFEGFGIVYLEAGLLGKPVIAGDSGGVSDAVIDNVNGFLIDPNDTNKIADAVINLCSNEVLRDELGNSGKRRVVANFDSKKQTLKIKNIVIKDI